LVLFFAVESSVINGVEAPSLVRITFNNGTDEVIVPVIVYSPLTAIPSAYVNALAGIDIGSSLLQLVDKKVIEIKAKKIKDFKVFM
jgi:hypothetical protein